MHTPKRLSTRRLLVLIVGVLLLVTSLTANVMLIRELQEAFARLQFSRIFPLGFADTGDLPAPTLTAPTLALYGDSRAQLWRRMDLPKGYQFINEGHGGQTSRQLLLQLRDHAGLHTTWAVVQIGINDLHPIGVLPDRRNAILAALRRNLEAITDELLERSHFVIVSTIVPPARIPLLRRALWDHETLAYIDSANETIRALGKRNRVFVLDAHAALRDRTSYLDPRYEDGDFFLHINDHAYLVLNREIHKIVLSVDPAAVVTLQ